MKQAAQTRGKYHEISASDGDFRRYLYEALVKSMRVYYRKVGKKHLVCILDVATVEIMGRQVSSDTWIQVPKVLFYELPNGQLIMRQLPDKRHIKVKGKAKP